MSKPQQIKALRKEIDELRQALNETTQALNYVTQYQADQARLIAEHWYRFILWMRPFELPPYRKPATIIRLYRPDDSPVLPSDNGKTENWKNPTRVDKAFLGRH